MGDAADPVGASVEVVVLTGHQPGQVALAERHLDAGRHVVTTVDSHARAADLLALDELARKGDRSLVVGACFSPGLTDVIAAYGATRLDHVHEVHFARQGAGGPQCAADRLDSVRREAHIWFDRHWVGRRGGSGRELCWFPDPIGGRDAYFADTAEPIIALNRFENLERCSARMVLTRRDRIAQRLPRILPAPAEGGVGAARVELRGTVEGTHVTIVFGVLDRPAVAAGVLVSEVVVAILNGQTPAGAIGAGSTSDPAELLRRLRTRGVRVAELTE